MIQIKDIIKDQFQNLLKRVNVPENSIVEYYNIFVKDIMVGIMYEIEDSYLDVLDTHYEEVMNKFLSDAQATEKIFEILADRIPNFTELFNEVCEIQIERHVHLAQNG